MRKFCLSLAILTVCLLCTQRAEAILDCYRICSMVLCPDAPNVYCNDGTSAGFCSDFGTCYPVEY